MRRWWWWWKRVPCRPNVTRVRAEDSTVAMVMEGELTPVAYTWNMDTGVITFDEAPPEGTTIVYDITLDSECEWVDFGQPSEGDNPRKG